MKEQPMRRRSFIGRDWPIKAKMQSCKDATRYLFLCLCVFASLCFGVNLQAQNVIISEFLTSNTRGITDENNDRVDWIEIHNRDTNTVNLLNWSLTDTTNDFRRWVFPA